MPALLIVGAGPEQLPILRVARGLGLHVVVTDRDPNAIGRPLADEFHEVSTDDKEGNLERAAALGVDGVTTFCSETAVPVVAHVCERLGLPGMSERTAWLATDKLAMKAAFREAGVPSTPFVAVEDLAGLRAFARRQGLPVVVKPAVNSGARGVTLVGEAGALASAYDDAVAHAHGAGVIAEGFAPGPEITVSAVVEGGEPRFLEVVERVCTPAPYFGICVEHRAPAGVPEATRREFLEVARRAVAVTEMEQGVASVQAIATPSGPSVVEVAARAMGGALRDLVMLRCGVDLAEVTVRQALGPEAVPERPALPTYPAVSIRFLTELDWPGLAGTVVAWTGLDEALAMPGVTYAELRLRPGDPVPVLTNTTGRFGAAVAVGDDREQASARSLAALRRIRPAGAEVPR